METIRILVALVAMLGLGCASTVLSVYVLPLWIRVQGQPHGRFAGLSDAPDCSAGGRKRAVFGWVGSLRRLSAPNPTLT